MKNSTLKNIGIFSSALLVAASAVYLYSPTFGSHAAESQQAEINLTVGSAIAIHTSADDVNLSANVGDFVHDSIDVDVITNSQYGYTLTIEDKDDDSSMKHTNASVLNVVSSEFEGAKTSSTMADNTWGFSLNATDYYHVPVAGNPAALKRTTSAVSGVYDRTTVDFGAKVGMNLTAGTYSDIIKFTAYVNGADNNPEDTSVNIREPGTVVVDPCKNAAYVSGGILTDPRDGNTYTVRGLKDGQCWMTQNLRLGGSTPITLTPANSDVAVDFELPASPAEADLTMGDFLYYDRESVYVDDIYGGYYNYYTATVGEGSPELTSGNAEHSICPKGWRLPTGGPDSDFYTLYELYNTPELLKGEPGLVLSGSVLRGTVYRGNGGYYWSSTVFYNYQYAYLMDFTDTSIFPDHGLDRNNGFAVRCIAR